MPAWRLCARLRKSCSPTLPGEQPLPSPLLACTHCISTHPTLAITVHLSLHSADVQRPVHAADMSCSGGRTPSHWVSHSMLAHIPPAPIECCVPCFACQVLDSLFDAGIIPVDRADISKRRFSALHSALVRSMAREKQMLAEAKGLKRRMEVRGVWGSMGCHMVARACGSPSRGLSRGHRGSWTMPALPRKRTAALARATTRSGGGASAPTLRCPGVSTAVLALHSCGCRVRWSAPHSAPYHGSCKRHGCPQVSHCLGDGVTGPDGARMPAVSSQQWFTFLMTSRARMPAAAVSNAHGSPS